MARNRAMAGPGSKKMGGMGIKAGRPPTAMAGSGLGAPPKSPAAAMGAPPMAPKVANVRPPGLGAGAPPPMPGGSGPPPPPPGGMGGSGGFAKGGGAKRFADGGPADNSDDARSGLDDRLSAMAPGPHTEAYISRVSKNEQKASGPNTASRASDYRPPDAYAKGGAVGGDTKPRHKGKSHK